MKRALYKDLLSWKNHHTRKPLVLDGARQTGKTWLLQTFGKREFRSTHYINFEKDPTAESIFEANLSPNNVVRLMEVYTGNRIDPLHDLIFLDEIQLCPRALNSLKYFAEEAPAYMICCAGSLIGLAGSSESYPVGKVTTRSLFPLSFTEYLGAIEPMLHGHFQEFVSSPRPLPELIHKKLLTRVFEFFVVGGMPEATAQIVDFGQLSADAITAIRRIHTDLVTGYQSDFAKHAGKENAHHLSRVFDSVPGQLSRDVDGNANRFRFKGVLPGSRRYRDLAGAIDWLTTTGLVHRSSVIESPNVPLRSHIRESIFKLYLLDVGLLHSMLNVPSIEIVNQSWGAYKGYAAENFAATELRAAGVKDLFNWKGASSEVEFLINVEGAVIPIEVKSALRTRRAKSLTAYREKYHPEVTVKVGGTSFHREKKLINVPLYAIGAVPEIVRRVSG